IQARNIYEANEYVALTNHQYSPIWIVISDEKFQSLSKKSQEAIEKAASEAQEYEHELAQQEWSEQREFLESEGMKFTTPDASEFREAIKDVYSDYPKLVPYVERIKETR